LGGRGEDWAFVENATAGLNAVIASLALAPATSCCACRGLWRDRQRAQLPCRALRARLVSVEVPVPFTEPAPLLSAISAAIGPKTRLASFDHITSREP